MTQRRTRHRSSRIKSALDPESMATPQDQLNDLTPDLVRCAWPGCRAHMGEIRRFGVLCQTHAVDVASAVLREQKMHVMVMDIFTRQTTEQAVRFSESRGERERHEADKAALRGDREGFVYYLMVGERLKIGYSSDVKQRLRQYPPGSELLAVEPGDRDLETQRHRQFAGSRRDGREWFRPTPDILELVEEIVNTYGDPRRFAHHYRRNEQPMRIRPAS